MMTALDEAGIPARQTIIWDRDHITTGGNYRQKHESIFYGWGGTHKFYGGRSKNSVWEFDNPAQSDSHPTAKPIALIIEAINNSSKDGDIVLDLFGGVGSTLIACLQTNRINFSIEADPQLCDTIRRRYANFIGKGKQWRNVTTKL